VTLISPACVARWLAFGSLGSLAWMLGPLPLICAALLTSAMLVRREFASASRAVMLRDA
jgi:uncharacterized membrane protein